MEAPRHRNSRHRNPEGACPRETLGPTCSSNASSFAREVCALLAASLASPPASDIRNSTRWSAGQSALTLRMGLEGWKLMSGAWASVWTIREKEKRLPERMGATLSLQPSGRGKRVHV